MHLPWSCPGLSCWNGASERQILTNGGGSWSPAFIVVNGHQSNITPHRSLGRFVSSSNVNGRGRRCVTRGTVTSSFWRCPYRFPSVFLDDIAIESAAAADLGLRVPVLRSSLASAWSLGRCGCHGRRQKARCSRSAGDAFAIVARSIFQGGYRMSRSANLRANHWGHVAALCRRCDIVSRYSVQLLLGGPWLVKF